MTLTTHNKLRRFLVVLTIFQAFFFIATFWISPTPFRVAAVGFGLAFGTIILCLVALFTPVHEEPVKVSTTGVDEWLKRCADAIMAKEPRINTAGAISLARNALWNLSNDLTVLPDEAAQNEIDAMKLDDFDECSCCGGGQSSCPECHPTPVPPCARCGANEPCASPTCPHPFA